MRTFTLCSLFLILSLFPANLFAYDFEVDGKCYSIISESDKTVSIVQKTTFSTYTGDFVIPERVEYNGNEYSVIEIAEDAFSYSKITSLTIPISIVKISSGAFSLCRNITSITNYATTPQAISSSTFYFSNNITLHVFEGLKAEYSSSTGWSAMTIKDDIPTIKATEIKLNSSSYVCEPYSSNKISYEIMPLNASIKDVKWSSSNPNIVYITSDGRFTGIKEGSATITATSKDGTNMTASCIVQVVPMKTESSSYNGFLSSKTTGYSMVSAGTINKYIGFNLVNNGNDFINVTKLRAINPNTEQVMATSTDKNLLGWLGNGDSFNLQVTIHEDISLIYEWTYQYKGQEYIFRSDVEYPSKVDSIINEDTNSSINEIYRLDGTKHNNITRGYNILKMSDGSIRKILVK